MAYTPTTWVTGDTVTATKMNKLENGVANAGGDYDLVIEYNMSTQSASVISGDILDCEDKLDNGDTVKAVCVVINDWSFVPSTANTNRHRYFLPLINFNSPYRYLSFGGVWATPTNNQSPNTCYVTMFYDASNGAIEDVYSGGTF